MCKNAQHLIDRRSSTAARRLFSIAKYRLPSVPMGFNYFLSSFSSFPFFFMRCHSVLLFACSNGMKLPSKSLILRVTREKFFSSLLQNPKNMFVVSQSTSLLLPRSSFFELTMFILLLVFAYRCYTSMWRLFFHPSILHHILCHICLMETNYFHFDGCFKFSLSLQRLWKVLNLAKFVNLLEKKRRDEISCVTSFVRCAVCLTNFLCDRLNAENLLEFKIPF